MRKRDRVTIAHPRRFKRTLIEDTTGHIRQSQDTFSSESLACRSGYRYSCPAISLACFSLVDDTDT